MGLMGRDMQEELKLASTILGRSCAFGLSTVLHSRGA
jgi:hypothetical protein